MRKKNTEGDVQKPYFMLLVAALVVVCGLLPVVHGGGLFTPVTSWWGPVDSRGIDRRPAGIFAVQVTSPPAMVGPVRYNVAWDSPSFVGDYNGRLLIAALGDDPSGCTQWTSEAFDDGTSFNGSILLFVGGTCINNMKHVTAAAVGAFGFLMAPLIQGDDAFDIADGSPPSPGSPYKPFVVINANDGLVLANAIDLDRTQPLNITFSGTGPMDPSDTTIVTQMVQQLNDTYPGGYDSMDCNMATCGNLRVAMDALYNPQIDFCLDRLSPIWCVHGRVIWLGLAAQAPLYVDVGIGLNFNSLAGLPVLAQLNLIASSGFTGDIPPAICDWPALQVLELSQIGGLTSLPDCFSPTSVLQFVSVQSSMLSSVPDSLLRLPLLTFLDLSANTATHFNSSLLSSDVQPWITVFRLTANTIVAPLPNCTGFPFLRDLQLGQNSFYVPANQLALAPHYFDRLPVLVTMSLASNNLISQLPTLIGAVMLQTLSISGNSFTGLIPSSWASLSSLLTLSASNNLITSPVTVLSGVLTLQSVDLSYNRLTSSVGSAIFDATPCVTQWIYVSLPWGIQSVNLRGNNMTFWSPDNGWGLPCTLTHLDLGSNNVQLWYSAFLQGCLNYLDVSDNNMGFYNPNGNGLTAGLMAATATYFNVQGNPLFTSPSLLSWMEADYSALTASPGVPYQCARIIAPTQPTLTILMDSSYLNYQLCTCISGTYPSPAAPTCPQIPDVAQISLPSDSLHQATTDVTELLLIDSQQWRVLNASQQANETMVLSDAAFGDQRSVSGMNTKWLINSTSSSSINSTAPVVTIFLSVNLDLFTDATNILSVYAGSNTQGVLQFSIAGNDAATLATGRAAALATPSSEAALVPFTNVATFTVQVLHPMATIQFQSRDTLGQHFAARQAFSAVCPPYYAPTAAFTTLGVSLPSTETSCAPVPFCTDVDVAWSVAPCDESSGRRLLTFNLNTVCLSGTYQASANGIPTSAGHLPTAVVGTGLSLPSSVSLECDYVARSSAGASALTAFLVLALAVAVATLVMLAVMHGRWYLLYGSSKLPSSRKAHPLVIWRFLGRSLYSFPLGSCALAIVGLLQLGPRTDGLCLASMVLWVMGVVFMQSVLLCGVYTMQQQLTRPLFDASDAAHIRRVTALHGAVIGANALVLLISGLVSPSSLSSHSYVIQSVSGGAELPVSVCAAPALRVSLLLGLGNAIWWLYTLWMSWGQLSSIGRTLDEVQEEIERIHADAAEHSSTNKKPSHTTIPVRVRSQHEIARVRHVQMSSVLAAMVLSSVLAGAVLILWGLSSTQPDSLASLASGSAALCMLGSLLPLVALLGWSLFRLGKKLSPRTAGRVLQPRKIVPTEAGEPHSGSTKGRDDSESERSSNRSMTVTASSYSYAYDPFRDHSESDADQAAGFTHLSSILANPFTMVQMYAFTRRTYQEESLDLLSCVRLLFSVVKHTTTHPTQQPYSPAVAALLERDASSLPHITASQLFRASPAVKSRGSDSSHVSTPGAPDASPETQPHQSPSLQSHQQDPADIDAGYRLDVLVHPPSPGMVSLAAPQSPSIGAHAGPAMPPKASAVRVSVPVFGDGTLLPCLHGQMHVCLAASADSGDTESVDALFVPRVGELLWAAFEIFNLYVVAGAPSEVNVAEGQRHTLRSSLATLCTEAATQQVDTLRPIATPASKTQLQRTSQDGSPIVTALDVPRQSLSPAPLAWPTAATLADPHEGTGAFLSPSAYLPLSVLCSVPRAAWVASLRSALQDIVSEVAKLVSTNVLSAFRQSKEGDDANRLLTLFERFEQCDPHQQLAFMQKAMATLTAQHAKAPPPLPHKQLLQQPPPTIQRQTSEGEATLTLPSPSAVSRNLFPAPVAAIPQRKPHLGLQQLHRLLHGVPFEIAPPAAAQPH